MGVGRKCCLLGTAREVLGTGRLEKAQDHLGASWLHKHSCRSQGKEKIQLGLHCAIVKILGGVSHIDLGAGGYPALAQQRALPIWKKSTCCQLEVRNENMCLVKVVLC